MADGLGRSPVPETLTTATLAALVRPHLDADPAILRFSRIPTGKHNASYRVDTDRGRFVLRIAPPDDGGCSSTSAG